MSLLNPVERQTYALGSVVAKLAKPLLNLFSEDTTSKAIKTKMNAVHSAVENSATGTKRADTFKTVAEKYDITVPEVKNIEKVFAYRSGGGGADENILGETIQTIRALVTKPTSGQADAEAFGGTPTTRASRRDKGFAVLKTGAVTIPTSSLITSWLINNDEEPTKKELTAFEKAFRKAYDAGEDTFTFKGNLYTTEMRESKNEGSKVGEVPEPPKGHAPFTAKTYQQLQNVLSGKITLEDLSEEDREQVEFLMESSREPKVEGSLLIPSEGMPVDTYTPEDQENAEETQLPDDEMEENYIDFVFSEALQPEEQEYLMETLAADSKLSQIFDKVVETASEFTGSGEVEGPGTGVSDSIPARLSDGEFVMTRKATDQLGADNLQVMMDDAERAYDGGLQRKNEGGLLSRPEEEELEENPEEEEINRLMMGSNRMPSIR